MDNYDVIVVGGSVAGASTSMLLARQGYNVLLVDKQVFPRDTNSTHIIWPRGASYLKRWGIAEKLVDKVPHCREMEINVEGISLTGSVPIADLEQRFQNLHGDSENLTDMYLGPRRHFLDNILIESAEESGVDVRQGCSFEEVIEEDGVIKGMKGRNSDGVVFKAYAQLVIGADGRYSNFAEQVHSSYIDYRPLSTFAYYGYFSGISQSELAIHKKGRFGTAIFPTMDDTHMVLVYGPNAWWDDFRKNAEANFHFTYDYCAPDIAAKVEAGTREEKFKACGAMPAFKRKMFGDGWVLIGDACSFKDQVSAMGITHAFRDAELITGYIDRALSGGSSMGNMLQDYEKVRSRDYDEYFNLVCDVAEMNPYTKAEIEQLYSIRNDQDKINAMISQFGDTLSLSGSTPSEQLPVIDYPESIRKYDVERQKYESNIYIQNNSVINSEKYELV